MNKSIILSSLLIAVFFLCGCQACWINVSDKDPADANPLDTKYDQGDLISWTDEIAQKITSHPFPRTDGKDKPVLVALGIQNRTKSHMDTKALSDTIRSKLLDSNKISFINADRRDDMFREQQFQQKHTSHESRVRIGKLLGADYMLTGSLVEIETKSGREVRASRKQDIFYQLTVEVTDLESGLIILSKQSQRMRRASRPIIGW